MTPAGLQKPPLVSSDFRAVEVPDLSERLGSFHQRERAVFGQCPDATGCHRYRPQHHGCLGSDRNPCTTGAVPVRPVAVPEALKHKKARI